MSMDYIPNRFALQIQSVRELEGVENSSDTGESTVFTGPICGSKMG